MPNLSNFPVLSVNTGSNNKYLAVTNTYASSTGTATAQTITDYGNALFPNCILYYPFTTDLLNYASGTPTTQGAIIGSTSGVYLNNNTNKFGVASLYSIGDTGTGKSNTTISYFNFSSGPTLPINQNGYTFSFWVNFTAFDGKNVLFFSNTNTSSNNSIAITTNNGSGTLNVVIKNSANTGTSSISGLTTGSWNHIVITVSTSGYVNIYLNGASSLSNSSSYYINPTFYYT